MSRGSNNSNEEKGRLLPLRDRRILIYTGSAIVVLTVASIFAYHKYQAHKASKAEGKALIDGTGQNYAKRLQLAFLNDGWWGTDVPLVRKVFQEIPYQEFYYKDVRSEYDNITKQNNKSLDRDLADELTATELSEMTAILNSKPIKKGQKASFTLQTAATFAHRIKAAFDYTILGMPSTDKGALETALRQIPSLYAFAMVKVVYKKEYGHDIENDLDSELDVFDFSWKDIIYKKPRT